MPRLFRATGVANDRELEVWEEVYPSRYSRSQVCLLDSLRTRIERLPLDASLVQLQLESGDILVCNVKQPTDR